MCLCYCAVYLGGFSTGKERVGGGGEQEAGALVCVSVRRDNFEEVNLWCCCFSFGIVSVERLVKW